MNNALDTWWETIVMACGHATAKQASSLLAEILDTADKDPSHARHLRLLAAACLETVQDIDPAVRARVDSMIRERLAPPRTLRETQSLAAIGHRVLRYLPDTLDELTEAKAAAAVRTAALTGTADALPLLAGYAQDTRRGVQSEIEHAWQYFDPERFADVVLADSPLNDGAFTIHSRRLLPYARRLRALTALSVILPKHEKVEDLSFTAELPPLIELDVYSSTNLDLTPLNDHQCLHHLRIWSAQLLTGMQRISALTNLRSLILRPTREWQNLDFLTNFPSLNVLHLSGSMPFDGDTRVDLTPIKALDRLISLGLPGYGEDGFRILRPMEGVNSLSITQQARRTPSLRGLSDTFPNLSAIELFRCDDVDLSELSHLPLNTVTPVGMRCPNLHPLAQIKHLRNLYLYNATNIDLRSLAGRKLRLLIGRGDPALGLDELGPGVRITYWPAA